MHSKRPNSEIDNFSDKNPFKKHKSLDSLADNSFSTKSGLFSKKEAKNLNFPDEGPNSLLNKFQQGDLIFGLTSPSKDVLIDKLKSKGFTHIYPNSLNDSVVGIVVDDDKGRAKKLDSNKLKHYHFLITYNNYLLGIADKFRNPRKIHRPGKPIPTLKKEPILGAAFRRSCKLLLVSRDNNRKWFAHFYTKNIDWKRVCEKDAKDDGVTNSEIRAAYRDYLENGIHPYILFYGANNQLQPPPWQQPEHEHHFKKYKHYLESKHSENNSEQIGSPSLTSAKGKA